MCTCALTYFAKSKTNSSYLCVPNKSVLLLQKVSLLLHSSVIVLSGNVFIWFSSLAFVCWWITAAPSVALRQKTFLLSFLSLTDMVWISRKTSCYTRLPQHQLLIWWDTHQGAISTTELCVHKMVDREEPVLAEHQHSHSLWESLDFCTDNWLSVLYGSSS